MTRINEISDKVENPDAYKNKLKLDKQSSARIIKRSLWQNAKAGRSQVNELVNTTLDSATSTGKRDLGDDDDDDGEDNGDANTDSNEHVDKKLKTI